MSDNEESYDILLKLVMIGDSGVGKTNILSRYINNEFSSITKATVGVEFFSTIIKKNNKLIKLQIWDTAGQERYKSITSAYYKGAKGAFVVYDITKMKTFKNLDKWITELKANGNEDIYIILIGNKLDLEKNREVMTNDVKRKAEELKVGYFETSALDGSNIEHAFDVIVEEMSKKIPVEDINVKKVINNNKVINIDVNKKDDKNKKGIFGCC
jgi:small GTP-binding protein